MSDLNYLFSFIRHGRSGYVFKGARFMTGDLLPWSQLRQRTL